MIDILLTNNPLDIASCLNAVTDPGVGGIDIFVGTVRNATHGKAVKQLEFEAYAPMAELEMQKIALTACTRWQLSGMLIHHRLGTLNTGDIPVIIAAAAPHRAAAFEACRFAIDTLKETVPIWKKEYYNDGEIWVAAHP